MTIEDSPLAQGYVQGMKMALQPWCMTVPLFFLSTYKQCGLRDTDAMLALQLLAFQREGNEFPLVEQLAARMAAAPSEILDALQRLLKQGHLSIEEGEEVGSGLRMERYNLDALLSKAAECYARNQLAAGGGVLNAVPNRGGQTMMAQPSHAQPSQEKSIHKVFEEEFGRLLTPMECETISKWVDEEHIPDALIRHALRESVFAGKLHFRYIDRILLEWRQQKIKTVDEAKQHAMKFRGAK